MPIPVPKGVTITVADGSVHVKGPKGQLEVGLLPGISASVDDGTLNIGRADEEAQTRSFHGLVRSLLANAATGVSEGWSKELEIVGIGYRAENQGKSVIFNLGYSHPINFAVPDGIEIEVDAKANTVKVMGFDRQQVGQIAADIRSLRPPEPYKGKGIRYSKERIRTKAGKQGATV
jgi:large subunit ribosomal protein L6